MEAIGRSLAAFMKEKKLDQHIAPESSEVLDHPQIAEWLERHPEWDKEKLRHFVVKLKQYVQEEENCSRCQGLDQCANLLKGHRMELIAYGGIIDVAHAPCLYQRQAEETKQRKSLVRSHHIG